MKKNILSSILVASSLLLVSCDNDLLTPFTPGALTEDVAITTSGDLQNLLNTNYAFLTDRTEAVFSSVFTDEVGIGIDNGGQGITTDYVFFMNSSSAAPISIWDGNYLALARTNRVLKFAETIVPVSNADKDVISRLKAEALVLRAYSHLKILSYFSPNPSDDAALAGILADKVFLTTERENKRATNKEFYTLIHNDLDKAISIFNTLPKPTNTIYANINLAKGLKARAYLTKGDYANADKFASEVIATSGIALANRSAYPLLFHRDAEPANSEVIFRLKRTAQQNSQGTNLHNGWCSIAPNFAGSAFYEISRSLYNLILSKPGDIRQQVIVAPSSKPAADYKTTSDYRKNDVLIIQKHGGTLTGTATAATTASNSFNNDHKIMRISEMYLIKAEALAGLGNLSGAAAAIKPLLDARYSNATLPVFTSQQQAFSEILTQRRIEFAYEGYRFLDLKRLGKKAGVGIDRDAADYSSSSSNYPGGNPVNLPMDSHKWALPIPQTELNANPTIQQNPNY